MHSPGRRPIPEHSTMFSRYSAARAIPASIGGLWIGIGILMMMLSTGCDGTSPSLSPSTRQAQKVEDGSGSGADREPTALFFNHPILAEREFGGEEREHEDESGVRAGASASPAERYEHKLVKQALMGLDFDEGVVEIDRQAGRQVADVGNPQAAAAKFAQAEDLLYRQNQTIQAIGAYTDAIFIDPSDPLYYAGLGRALAMQGEVPEAEVALLTCLKMDDGNVARTWFDLGALYYSNGEYAPGIAAYRRVVMLNPDSGQAHQRLASALYYAGDYQGAWHEVHEAARCGTPVAPQLLPLLSARARDPGR